MTFKKDLSSKSMKLWRETFKSNSLLFELSWSELINFLIHSTGPVQFPVSPPNPQRQQQQLEQQRRIISHIVEKQALIPHPYARLALNYRAQQLTRFSGKVSKHLRSLHSFYINSFSQDDQLPLIYQALASHGRRVQNNDFQRKNFIPRSKHHHNRIDEDYQEESDPIRSSSSNHEKKQYRFSYAVKDKLSGDDFSHSQKQENGAVHGSYKVQLPDGRTQIVKYTADDVHGYRAVVTYEGETKAQEAHTQPTPIRHQQRLYYPQIVNQVEINNVRHTVTPTPYSSAEYNIRAPSALKYYPSTTALPRHYY